MAVTVAAVMRQIRNFFQGDAVEGVFSITGNGLTPAPDAPWVYISGSAYHNGAYALSGGVLQGVDKPDETFEGVVWPLHPPDDFLALCEEIAAFDGKNPTGAYQSESFGSYSYSRTAEGAKPWQQAFADRLTPYRRMFTEVG